MENLNDLHEDIVPVRRELTSQTEKNNQPAKKQLKTGFYSGLMKKLKQNKDKLV